MGPSCPPSAPAPGFQSISERTRNRFSSLRNIWSTTLPNNCLLVSLRRKRERARGQCCCLSLVEHINEKLFDKETCKGTAGLFCWFDTEAAIEHLVKLICCHGEGIALFGLQCWLILIISLSYQNNIGVGVTHLKRLTPSHSKNAKCLVFLNFYLSRPCVLSF